MKNRAFILAASIGALLGVADIAEAQSSTPSTPIVTVFGSNPGNAYSYTFWIGGPGEGWSWDHSYVEPGNYYPPEEAPPQATELCGLLAAQGLPEGCNREYAHSPAPEMERNFPWQQEALRDVWGGYYSGIVDMYDLYARYGAISCYSDIANDPGMCEAQFVQSIQSMCSTYFPYGETDGYYPWSETELCYDTAETYATRAENAASMRWFGSFFGDGIAVGVGQFEINLNLSISEGLHFGPFNSALLEARRHRNCQQVIGEWDANNCGGRY